MSREREPWEIAPPQLAGRDSEAYRRYQRSRALVRFAWELGVWERAGKLDHPRYARKIAYRRLCLERWEAYLDGQIDPPHGAFRREGGGDA